MRYEVREEARPATNGLDGRVMVLADTTMGGQAEIWPALGCNCYRWQVATAGQPVDLLYAASNLFEDTRPTRSGIPILFPFPNRIRGGAFSWDGKTYQLPLNDSLKKNAIHGFACRHPWRIVDRGADNDSAWLRAEFHCSRDAPEDLKLWPADHRIEMTFRLRDRRLILSASIVNPDQKPLPFGLGYHPYLRIPLFPGASKEECLVQASAETRWELEESLPTGKKFPVTASSNLIQPRRVTELTLDDVLARQSPATAEPLPVVGRVRQGPGGSELRLRAAPSFRELVVFTPPHRDAFCLEPYTCTTDAINLQQAGVDAGLQVLSPGGRWSADIELEYVPAP